MFDTDSQKPTARRLLGAAIAAFAGAALLAPQAVAQQAPAPQAEEFEVSGGELEAFAEAHIEVQDIRGEMSQTVQEAEDPQEAQAAQEEADQKMVEAIEAHDLTTERYTEIAQAVNRDPELQQRFQEIIQEILDEREEGVSG